MGVYIPNMEKPKDCSECILADKHLNGLCEAKYYCRLEADSCPLIEIVRCGECKQLDHTKWCDLFLHYMNEDDFCSYGERRADEHTDKRD